MSNFMAIIEIFTQDVLEMLREQYPAMVVTKVSYGCTYKKGKKFYLQGAFPVIEIDNSEGKDFGKKAKRVLKLQADLKNSPWYCDGTKLTPYLILREEQALKIAQHVLKSESVKLLTAPN